MAVLHLNPENFEQTVSNGKVMVDFWAPWCMPCQSLLPTIDALGEELEGNVTVAKVNVDENKVLAVKFRVMSIPTVISWMAWKKNVWLELIQKKNIWRSSIISNQRNQLSPPI